jgi:hypothetical protein
VNILDGIINLFRFNKTNWKAVALCLLAATVFWFFNALNKEHTATISLPVKFKYDQAHYIPVKKLPQHIQLNLTGSGWDLLRKSLGLKVTPLSIVVERPSEALKISPASLFQSASKQLGQTKLNQVVSDTLLLSLEPRKTKKAKLVLGRNQLRFELGFGIASPIAISPDSVVVEGPASKIFSIPDSIFLSPPQARITNDVNSDFEIISPLDDLTTIRPGSANVKFDVSELTDITRKIKVVVLPSPPFRHQVSEDSMRVSFRVPIKALEAFQSSSLFATIDLQSIEPGVSKVVPVVKGLSAYSMLAEIDSITIRKY